MDNKINETFEGKNANEIMITVEIKSNEDLNKRIYFLDNTDGDYYENNLKVSYHHDNLPELNVNNTRLLINNQKETFKKYFKPKEKGIYTIKLVLNFLMTNCKYMFFDCKNIIKIDLSGFNSKNVTTMEKMFSGCENLREINFSLFNTENVTDMKGMFNECKNITKFDLFSFNTENVTNMKEMFFDCENVTKMDLSSFNTKKVDNTRKMFGNCYKLTDIDLSSFNTQGLLNKKGMVLNCKKLNKIKVGRKSYVKIKNLSRYESSLTILEV